MAKSKTYGNKIDALLGLSVGDVDELRKTSRPHQQRLKQLARWTSHVERKWTCDMCQPDEDDDGDRS